jgi:hypothetical protein
MCRLASFQAWGTGELEAAQQALEGAIEILATAGERVAMLAATLELAYVRALRGDHAALDAEARRVLAETDGDREPFLRLQALGAVAFADFFLGRFRDGEAACHEAAAIAERQGKDYFLTWTVSEVGFNRAFSGRTREAYPPLEEARSRSESWRDTPIPDWMTAVHLLAGDVSAALSGAEDSLARNPGGMSRRRGIGMVFAALAAVEAGRPDDARRYLGVARAAYGEDDWSFYRHYCGHAAGMLAFVDDRPGEAVAIFSQVAESLLAMEIRPLAALVLLDLAEAAAVAGDPERAEEAARDLAAAAVILDCPLYHGLAALASGWAALTRQRPPESAEAQKAVDVLSGLGCRLYLGRALDVLGRLIAPDPAAARRALDSAATIFQECGARWRQDRAGEALDGLEGR